MNIHSNSVTASAQLALFGLVIAIFGIGCQNDTDGEGGGTCLAMPVCGEGQTQSEDACGEDEADVGGERRDLPPLGRERRREGGPRGSPGGGSCDGEERATGRAPECFPKGSHGSRDLLFAAAVFDRWEGNGSKCLVQVHRAGGGGRRISL